MMLNFKMFLAPYIVYPTYDANSGATRVQLICICSGRGAGTEVEGIMLSIIESTPDWNITSYHLN